ncbi:transposase [Mycoplasmopsis bovis]|nr:transposase [Mycoplasmopsis bovis]AXJ71798.1 transposase [Mycoplasmopsis bovis]AXJ72660.1 transposase [Mycoplasmopsis bovis]AXJ79173.1 transposase [Mycoplasmopsis bovis]QIT09669.1 transposase [Mycoplasmopsis bovis]
MAVPAEIRAIERPKNTVVKKSGSMWAVIERVGCIRKNGNNQPVEGKVIGHIIDGKFVPKEKLKITVSMKNFGDYEIAKSVSKDLLTDLSNVYPQDMAKHIYAVALLRSINPRMTNNKLDEVFNESFMSVESPELKLGKNNVSSLIKWIGKDYSKVLEFIQNRVSKIDESNKIAIDGMLKNNNSKVNSLNDFSYKSKLKNSKNISILIAFNVTTRDVICSLPYSGNCVDVTSFPDFLEKTGINKGIIIGDKGINSSALMSNVGFIHPLKRSLKLLEEIDAYNMKDKINSKDEPTWCKKIFHNGLYYYAFRNLKRASKEEQDFMSSKKFSIERYEKIKHKFGTIVYVSDQDITCEDALNLYKQRWEIELVNDFYKNTLELETVRQHDDYSVYGDEFLNMLTLIIGNRIKNKFADSRILETKTYRDVMKIFKQYKKIQMPYKNDIWYETELPKKSMELIEKILY